jgi:hypothetical protein
MELGLGLGFFPVEANYEARVFVEKKDVAKLTILSPKKKDFFKGKFGYRPDMKVFFKLIY